ncbi:MAG TPA: hypothetical protein VKB73_14390 [Gaiellaceae bacterium]|nr:hypothetical protein [Gaiellaceae bacterium]
MDAGPVVQSPPRVEQQNAERLGPISPELVLVDPLLAEQARKLLPDPAELYRPRPYRVVERPSVLVPLEPRPRRRWPRTVALAALVFGAGAASGDLLRDRHPAESGALELRTAAPAAPALTGPGERQARPNSAPHQAPRRASGRASAPAARRAPEQSWAVNVIGVAAQVTGPRVSLVWQRPAGSAHVVVLRALGDRQRGTVVFRGHATSFRDDPPRACTSYRYTIVNYDLRGHRSTGVPTSVVTGGCT